MRRRSMLLIAAVATIGLLSLAVGTASGRTLHTDTSIFRIHWTGLTLIGSNGSRIRCRVTLAGGFRSFTFAKTVGRQIGEVTKLRFAECEGGTVIDLEETYPWSIEYAAFRSTLPNIEAIRLHVVGARISVAVFPLTLCLGTTTETTPIALELLREPRGQITAVSPDSTIRIALRNLNCFAATGSVSGSGEMFAGFTSERVRYTLI